MCILSFMQPHSLSVREIRVQVEPTSPTSLVKGSPSLPFSGAVKLCIKY